MRYALERKDYEELFLLGPGEADGQGRRRWLESQYPKSTAQAVVELRTRGLAATPSSLDYILAKGLLPSPAMEGGRRRWTAEDIDRAAEFLDAEGVYVPGTVMRRVLNLDAAQDIRALRRTLAEHPEVPTADLLVLEVLPGAAGAGVRATARYRPMTDEERAEWRRRIRRGTRKEDEA